MFSVKTIVQNVKLLNREMGQKIGTIKFCHLKAFFLIHLMKVPRTSSSKYGTIFEWTPYVFYKDCCSECQTNRVMGQNIWYH